jgi:hypothetical protein
MATKKDMAATITAPDNISLSTYQRNTVHSIHAVAGDRIENNSVEQSDPHAIDR